ncbi:unnamed protein product [marine sediment metagenome]|uniref:Uncharacterized protein n=1 Tax=marine sediment metagenome TaxID=412755 RepID=X0TVL9_9ZZZZ
MPLSYNLEQALTSAAKEISETCRSAKALMDKAHVLLEPEVDAQMPRELLVEEALQYAIDELHNTCIPGFDDAFWLELCKRAGMKRPLS